MQMINVNVLTASDNYLFIPSNSDFYIYGRGTAQYIIKQNRITDSSITDIIKKLSSGKRIISASDDPSGMAMSQKLDTIIKGIRQESMNMQDYRNYLLFAESAIAQDNKILQRIRELTVRSAGGIMNKDDREIIQTEISQFLKQIDMNAKNLQFNTKAVIPELTVKRLGLDNVDVIKDPYTSMKLVDAAMEKVQKKRIVAGIKGNILKLRIDGAEIYYVNAVSSLSRISDQDMSEGIRTLSGNSILIKAQYGLLIKSK